MSNYILPQLYIKKENNNVDLGLMDVKNHHFPKKVQRL